MAKVSKNTLAILMCGTLVILAMLCIPLRNQFNQNVDLGIVTAEEITHSFKLANIGMSALNVSKVTTSCGCTVLANHPEEIKPFSTGVFPVEIKLKGKNGVFESSVTIEFAETNTAVFKLKGTAYPLLSSSLELNDTLKGASYTFSLPPELKSGLAKTLVENDVFSLHPLTSSLCQLKLKTTAPSGEFERAFVLKDPVSGKGLTVKTIGRVVPDIKAKQNPISIGYLSKTLSYVDPIARIQFYSPYKKRFSLNEGLTVIPKGFSFQLAASQNDNVSIDILVMINSLDLGMYKKEAKFAFNVDRETVMVPTVLFGYVLE